MKKSDDAAYDYALKNVNNLIQKIESMAEKINLSLFREFFESLPVDYARYLINLKNTEKKIVTEAENRTSDSEDTMEKMSKKEKKIVPMKH